MSTEIVHAATTNRPDRDLVEAVRLSAEHDADLLSEFLSDQGHLDASSNGSKPQAGGLSLPAALRLAALLRRREWQRNDQDQFISGGLPETAENPEVLLEGTGRTSRREEARTCRQFALKVFLAWIRNFSWSALRDLRIDIVLGGQRLLKKDGLELVADFLWVSRDASKIIDGGDHASS